MTYLPLLGDVAPLPLSQSANFESRCLKLSTPTGKTVSNCTACRTQFAYSPRFTHPVEGTVQQLGQRLGPSTKTRRLTCIFSRDTAGACSPLSSWVGKGRKWDSDQDQASHVGLIGGHEATVAMGDATGWDYRWFCPPEGSFTSADTLTHGALGLTFLAEYGPCEQYLVPQCCWRLRTRIQVETATLNSAGQRATTRATKAGQAGNLRDVRVNSLGQKGKRRTKYRPNLLYRALI